MGTALNNLSLLKNHDTIGVSYGRQTMCDNKGCSSAHQLIHTILNNALGTGINGACRLIENQYRRNRNGCTRDSKQLPLTLVLDKDGTVLFSHYGASLTDVPADCGAAQSLLEDLDVAKPVDVDDADVTIYADPGAAPDIPGLTPHVHEYAQPNLGETGVFSVFDDAYKDEE